MRSNLWILCAVVGLLMVGCGGKPPATQVTAPQTTASTNPNSNIGKTDEMGVTVSVDVPDKESCKRTHVSVKNDTFQECLLDGLSYVQVANTLGYKGKLSTKSGNTEIWQWNGGTGQYLTATFVDGKMISKSQAGLQ